MRLMIFEKMVKYLSFTSKIDNLKKIKEVVKAAKDNNCSIRVGVNAGSLEKDILEKWPNPTSGAGKSGPIQKDTLEQWPNPTSGPGISGPIQRRPQKSCTILERGAAQSKKIPQKNCQIQEAALVKAAQSKKRP